MKDSPSTRITTALAEIKDAEANRKSYEFDDGPSCAKCFQSVSVESDAEFNPGDFCTSCTYDALDASRETIERLVKFAELATEVLGEYNDPIQSGGMTHYYAESTLKKLNSILTGGKP